MDTVIAANLNFPKKSFNQQWKEKIRQIANYLHKCLICLHTYHNSPSYNTSLIFRERNYQVNLSN